MAIYSKSNTFAANTVISSTNVNQNFDEISTAINTTLCGGTNAVLATKGGTGQTSLTTGDTLYASATNTVSKLSIGTAGQTLQVLNGIPTWQNVSSGAKNYVTYKDFENNATTGWGLGTVTLTSNLPTGVPTFGSGASGNLTLSATSSGKLAGSYSLSLASSAATTAGNFIASDALTIDIEDQAKVLAFKFYYSPTVNASNANWSGTSSNSFGVAIYDITNSAWIIPAGVFNLTQSAGVGICQGTFQTPSNMTSFRLVIYNAAATSNSITILYDDFYVGPQSLAFGPPVSDWLAYTPTGAWVSNTTYTGQWRRVGDSMQIQAKASTSGAPTTASFTVSIPSGYTIDTAKLTGVVPYFNEVFGTAVASDSDGTAYKLVPSYSTTTTVGAAFQNSTAGSMAVVTQAAPFTFGSGDYVIVNIQVPIVGWSSNTTLSADSDTRVVAAIISGDPASATSGNPIIVPTIGYDSHGGYNATTGRYTVTVTGIYRMYGALTSASSATTLTIYKNAVSTSLCGNLDSNGEATYCGAVNCITGDVIDIRPGGTVDATAMTLNIERLSGPSVVAATETVAASITGDPASATVGNPIIVPTVSFDTHGNYNATTGRYTCAVSGIYQVSGALLSASSATTLTIYKNAVAGPLAGNLDSNGEATFTGLVKCVGGDVIDIRPGGTVDATSMALHFAMLK